MTIDTRAAHFFDRIAPRYDRVYAPDREASRKRMDRILRELSPKSRVLDLGVGTGRELPALEDAGHSVIGLDISREMLALCARRARPVPVKLADFWEPLPCADGAFDAVLALHGTLAHAPSSGALAGLAAEVARVLAPGGVFLAEVPSPVWLEAATGVEDSRGDRRVRRIAEDACLYEDTIAEASIVARFLSAQAWHDTLARHFAPHIEALGETEMLIAARRLGDP